MARRPRLVEISASFEEVEDWLVGVTYKPGVTFTAEHSAPAATVVVRFAADDVRRTEFTPDGPKLDTIMLTHRLTLPARSTVYDRRSFLQWLRHSLGTIELHERDEWFLVDGRRMYDPHEHPGLR